MPKRPPFTKKKLRRIVGVVGEGPSEWHYATDMNRVEEISISLRPVLPKHSDYQEIFRKAKQLVREGYEEVYCLIDMDTIKGSTAGERTYQTNKNKLLKNAKITVIETHPCLEFWYLLHFKPYSAKTYTNCHEVIRELKKYIPDYEKSNDYLKKKRIYKFLGERGDARLARESAVRLRETKLQNDLTPNLPYTEIDLFIERLTVA